MAENIGEIMRKIRVNKNYSQEYVSETAGIDYTTYSRYERGETAPKFETIVALSNLYKLTLDEFYHYDDPTFSVGEPKQSYLKKWTVPITIALDGTDETLEMWLIKLKAINGAI